MEDFESRYAGVARGTFEDEETGARVTYYQRRFLPQQTGTNAARRTVDASQLPDRLDLVAFANLGDAFAFWRICDTNEAMNPFDLVAECDGRVEIPSELS